MIYDLSKLTGKKALKKEKNCKGGIEKKNIS